MDASTREYLRIVISVALTMATRAVKRAYFDRRGVEQEAARKQVSQAVADAVVQQFDLSRKPDQLGVSASSNFMASSHKPAASGKEERPPSAASERKR